MSALGLKSVFFSRRRFCRMSPADLRLYGALSRLNWCVIAGFLLGAFATVSVSRLKISGDLVPLPVVVFVGFGLLSVFYTCIRKDAFVSVLSNTIALAAAANFAGGMFSYTTQFWGASLPLRDASFAEFDSALGVDWVAWFGWLNAHPFLANVLRNAYMSLPFQILFLSIAQFVYSFEIRVQRLILAILLCGVITFAVAAVVPALNAYYYFDSYLTAHDDVTLSRAISDSQVAAILNLRGLRPVIPIDNYQGIITFPSFHTVLGILFVWTAWPSRLMRWAALAVNGLLILATPLNGAHYGVDVIAGTGVACLGIWVTNRVSGRIESSQQRARSGAVSQFAAAGPTEPGFAGPTPDY
jgi:PAP2 superfamily